MSNQASEEPIIKLSLGLPVKTLPTTITQSAIEFLAAIHKYERAKLSGAWYGPETKELIRLDMQQFFRSLWNEFKDSPHLTDKWKAALFSPLIRGILK